jgi:hypothetical protein
MATIKTRTVGGQRRIITKVVGGQRRVSCSCCEEPECCMYPAEAVESGVITFEDLPDQLVVENPEVIIGPWFYDKVNAPYTLLLIGKTFEVYYEGPLINNPPLQTFICLEGDQWVFINTDGGSTLLDQDFLECLIDNFVAITDTFADIYTVNTYDEFVGGSPASSFTITRQSLCVWSGFDARYNDGEDVALRYNTPNESSTRASMWTVANSGRFDAGPYNSPEGVYLDGNYVWEVVP